MKQEDIDIYELCLLADYFGVTTDFILGRTSIRSTPESSNIYDNKGNLIASIGSEKRQIVKYDELPEVLIDAQKQPENYKDLLVRVAGYTAFFVELGKDIQDDIIQRTEIESWG